jgi:hypothetical protein
MNLRRVRSAVVRGVYLLAALTTIFVGIRSTHKPIAKEPALATASGSATAQSSTGPQSPILGGGQHNVQILYGSTVVTNAPPPVSSSHRVISQSSTGDRSPNINGVGGNVDIHY